MKRIAAILTMALIFSVCSTNASGVKLAYAHGMHYGHGSHFGHGKHSGCHKKRQQCQKNALCKMGKKIKCRRAWETAHHK